MPRGQDGSSHWRHNFAIYGIVKAWRGPSMHPAKLCVTARGGCACTGSDVSRARDELYSKEGGIVAIAGNCWDFQAKCQNARIVLG